METIETTESVIKRLVQSHVRAVLSVGLITRHMDGSATVTVVNKYGETLKIDFTRDDIADCRAKGIGTDQ